MAADAPSAPRWDDAASIAAFRTLESSSPTRVASLFLDDETIKRFLRARRGVAADALAMLLEHQAWRRTDTPWWPCDPPPLEGVQQDNASLKAYLCGEDGEGGPITWVRAGLHDKNEDRAQLKRFLAFLSDESVARMDRSERAVKPPGMNIVVDFTGFGYAAGFECVFLWGRGGGGGGRGP